jgi:hypothetical protein
MRTLTKKQKEAFEELGMFYPEYYNFKGDEIHVKFSRNDIYTMKRSLQTLSDKYSKSDDLNIQDLKNELGELLCIFEEIEKNFISLDFFKKPLDPFDELARKRTNNLHATSPFFDSKPTF